MSEIKKKIEQNYIIAFKAKDIVKKDALASLKTKIIEWEKNNNGKEISDQDIYGIIGSEIKKRQQTISLIAPKPEIIYSEEQLQNMNDNSLKENLQILALQEYLPQQFTDQQLEEMIKELITDSFVFSGEKNAKIVLGAVMKEFNTNYKGQFDNNKLKTITEQILEL